MNPNPLRSAFHAIARALALAFVGFFTTISNGSTPVTTTDDRGHDDPSRL